MKVKLEDLDNVQKQLLNEFLETVKIDLFEEEVFVFTPRGEVKQLPHGSTPIDFTYF